MGGQKTMRVVRAIVLSFEQREINNRSSACRTTLGEMLQDDRVMTVIWKTPS
jgi:hypothetical protein